jgi:hypothetical protein
LKSIEKFSSMWNKENKEKEYKNILEEERKERRK